MPRHVHGVVCTNKKLASVQLHDGGNLVCEAANLTNASTYYIADATQTCRARIRGRSHSRSPNLAGVQHVADAQCTGPSCSSPGCSA